VWSLSFGESGDEGVERGAVELRICVKEGWIHLESGNGNYHPGSDGKGRSSMISLFTLNQENDRLQLFDLLIGSLSK
jgi:hypothetical protein